MNEDISFSFEQKENKYLASYQPAQSNLNRLYMTNSYDIVARRAPAMNYSEEMNRVDFKRISSAAMYFISAQYEENYIAGFSSFHCLSLNLTFFFFIQLG